MMCAELNEQDDVSLAACRDITFTASPEHYSISAKTDRGLLIDRYDVVLPGSMDTFFLNHGHVEQTCRS